jgi:hypothetical protein
MASPRATAQRSVRAQRYRLAEPDPLSDDGGLADHHARPVIDEKAWPDFRSRVNIDAGPRMRDESHQARDQRRSQEVQRACEPIADNRNHARIAEQDLRHRRRTWISFISGTQIGSQHRAYRRKLQRKLMRDVVCHAVGCLESRCRVTRS